MKEQAAHMSSSCYAWEVCAAVLGDLDKRQVWEHRLCTVHWGLDEGLGSGHWVEALTSPVRVTGAMMYGPQVGIGEVDGQLS